MRAEHPSGVAPALGLGAEDTLAVLAAAGLAPSVHNTQPWAFRTAPDVIELLADRSRRLPVADPHDAELRLACGAALFNLRVALQGHGVRPVVAVLPDRTRPDLLAEIRRGGATPPSPEILRLLRAIPHRHTNRSPFADSPVEPPEQHALLRAAAEEGARLHLVHDPSGRAELARLARQAHRRQNADPAFRAEFTRWTATGGDRPDGVPAAAAGPRPAPHDTWVLRDFTGGTGHERVPGKDFEDEPIIAVLVAHSGGPAADVQAGQALQRVLLTATAEGLAASFLSQLVEVPDVRESVRRIVGAARPPRAVLRLGRGWPVPRVPRRTVADTVDGPAPTADG